MISVLTIISDCFMIIVDCLLTVMAVCLPIMAVCLPIVAIFLLISREMAKSVQLIGSPGKITTKTGPLHRPPATFSSRPTPIGPPSSTSTTHQPPLGPSPAPRPPPPAGSLLPAVPLRPAGGEPRNTRITRKGTGSGRTWWPWSVFRVFRLFRGSLPPAGPARQARLSAPARQSQRTFPPDRKILTADHAETTDRQYGFVFSDP